MEIGNKNERKYSKQEGRKLNKLLRYREILDCYLKHKTEDIPTTVVYRKYIYPRFFISRRTLYTILATPVNKEIKELLTNELK